MKPFAMTALAILLAGPAFAQSATEKTGVNSLIGVAPTTEDFVLKAATSDMFEIEFEQARSRACRRPDKNVCAADGCRSSENNR